MVVHVMDVDGTRASRSNTREQHIDALTQTLNDPNASARRGAAVALGGAGMGGSSGAKGAALACRLGDVDMQTRVSTAYALLHNGMPQAPGAMEQAGAADFLKQCKAEDISYFPS